MKKNKSLLTVVLSLIMCMCFSATALAGTSTDNKAVDGYGILAGTITAEETYVDHHTRISSNPDNAYLKIKLELLSSGGSVMYNHTDSAPRGDRVLADTYDEPNGHYFEGVYRVYGAHNVQGGGTYGAQVVYTRTQIH